MHHGGCKKKKSPRLSGIIGGETYVHAPQPPPPPPLYPVSNLSFHLTSTQPSAHHTPHRYPLYGQRTRAPQGQRKGKNRERKTQRGEMSTTRENLHQLPLGLWERKQGGDREAISERVVMRWRRSAVAPWSLNSCPLLRSRTSGGELGPAATKTACGGRVPISGAQEMHTS